MDWNSIRTVTTRLIDFRLEKISEDTFNGKEQNEERQVVDACPN
jgi:hypothetical protein